MIDSLWIEHLTAIDDLRDGIGLRAYGQRDPLIEFKIEAYRMFDELQATIRHDVTHTIFRVTLQTQPARQRPVARNVVEGRANRRLGPRPSGAARPPWWPGKATARRRALGTEGRP